MKVIQLKKQFILKKNIDLTLDVWMLFTDLHLEKMG